jgi:hypothetical protein
MIVELVGLWFRVMARFRPGDEGRDLDRLGSELLRLGRQARSPPQISR